MLLDGVVLRGGPTDGVIIVGPCLGDVTLDRHPNGRYISTGERTALGLVIYLWHAVER